MSPLSAKDWKLIHACPPPGGDGVYLWTFKVLCMLARHTPFESELFDEARRLISRYATKLVSDQKIRSQIPNARRYASGQGGARHGERKSGGSTHHSARRSPEWPPADFAAIERIVRQGPALAELTRRSPIPLDGGAFSTAAYLEALFPGDPLLCCAWAKYNFKTMHRSAWGDLGGMQFIVPSPMSKIQGRTLEGKMSHHSADNTGPRRFLVIEFDFKPANTDNQDGGGAHACTGIASLVGRLMADGITVLDMCSALLWHLSRHRSLAMVVHSGGKSLHGWFYCQGESEASLEGFMRYAVLLGADKRTWTPSQFLRMPEGTRADGTPQGRRQAVHYFNPAFIPRPHIPASEPTNH